MDIAITRVQSCEDIQYLGPSVCHTLSMLAVSYLAVRLPCLLSWPAPEHQGLLLSLEFASSSARVGRCARQADED